MKIRGEKKFKVIPHSKTGLSAVITTLILIFLVLVAVGIIWVTIRDIIKQGAEEINFDKFKFNLIIKAAYIDGTDVKVLVKNSGGIDVFGVRFIFFNGTDNIVIDRKIPLTKLQEELFIFNSAELGSLEALLTVSISPIYLLDSGKEKIGDISDTATILGFPSGEEPGESGTGSCGDGIAQSPNGDGEFEVCDGTDFAGQNCITQGFDGGEIVCNSDCLSFDVSSCTLGAPSSCDGFWSPPEDSGVECDGGANCHPSCTCPAGYTANGEGGCNLNPPLNIGIIYSVWPSGAVKYFDSLDLPVDVSLYPLYYVNFTNSLEIECYKITWAEYLEGNNRSYIRTEDVVNINIGEQYNVWEAEDCGVLSE